MPATDPATNVPSTSFERTYHFLSHILPPQPLAYIAWLVDEKWRHRAVANDLTEVANISRRLSAQRHQTYIALASFKEARVMKPSGFMGAHRAQENVASIRSLVLDIDSKDHGTVMGCLQAFSTAWKASGMPGPSYLINSGGGLHVYWLLETPMSPIEHRRRAALLANLFKQYGLKADYGCTVDCARVLRAPGTWNWKYDPPQEVTILSGFDGWVDPGALDAALGADAASNVITLDPAIAGGQNADLRGVPHSDVAFRFDRIARDCPTMAGILERRGAGDSYEMWKNALHLAAYTEDGADWVHALSDGHAGYKAEEVDFKFQESLNAKARPNVGPPTCATFAATSSACRTCPYNGQIRSPISLGLPAPAPEVVADDAEDPTYIRDGRTYLIRRIQNDNGSIERADVLVAPFAMKNFTVARFGILGEAHLHFTMGERGVSKNLAIPLADMADTKSGVVARTLGMNSVMLSQREVGTMKEALMAWVNQLRARSGAKSAIHIDTSGYGWCQQGAQLLDDFAYAGTIYHADGSSTEASPHPDIADVYCPQGSLEAWKAAAAKLCEDPRPVTQVVLAAAFAAPLMRFVPGTSSFTLSLFSPSSGVGKTTMLRCAAAVWGEPVRSMRQLNDTTNAVVRHMAMTPDLPAYWDDIRGSRNVDAFLEVMFQLTQGREKERLNRQGRASVSGKLRTILTVASNASLAERVSERDRTSDATARRVLEFAVPRQADLRMDLEARALLEGVHAHYGHAGRVFAATLPRNRELIIRLRNYYLDALQAAIEATHADRFWVDASAMLLVGATLARQCGLVPIDTERLRDFLVEQMRTAQKKAYGDPTAAAHSILADILFVNEEFIIECEPGPAVAPNVPEGSRPKKGSAVRKIKRAPRKGSATVEILPEKRTILISSSAIANFVYQRRQTGLNAMAVHEILRSHFGAAHERATPGRNTPFAGITDYCKRITFDSDEEFQQILERD